MKIVHYFFSFFLFVCLSYFTPLCSSLSIFHSSNNICNNNNNNKGSHYFDNNYQQTWNLNNYNNSNSDNKSYILHYQKYNISLCANLLCFWNSSSYSPVCGSSGNFENVSLSSWLPISASSLEIHYSGYFNNFYCTQVKFVLTKSTEVKDIIIESITDNNQDNNNNNNNNHNNNNNCNNPFVVYILVPSQNIVSFANSSISSISSISSVSSSSSLSHHSRSTTRSLTDIVSIPAITYSSIIGPWVPIHDCSSLSNGLFDSLVFFSGTEWQLAYDLGGVTLEEGTYQLSLTIKGDGDFDVTDIRFIISFLDYDPPQSFEYLFSPDYGVVKDSWTEIIVTTFIVDKKTNITFVAENLDVSLFKYGIWIDTFYIVPETFPGSGIFSNFISQFDSVVCPLHHPYPFARVGNGNFESPSYMSFFPDNCHTLSNGGFTILHVDQATLTFRGTNIYGSQELVPGNYTVSIVARKDTQVSFFPCSVNFISFDGTVFAEIGDWNFTDVGNSWSEVFLSTIEIKELQTAWRIEIYSKDTQQQKIGIWLDTLYVTPISITNVINVGSNPVCNRNLDRESSIFYNDTKHYEVALSKTKDMANENYYFVMKSDCSTLSGGKNPVIILWSAGLFWFYHTYESTTVLEPNVYTVSITFRYYTLWSDPVPPFAFYFEAPTRFATLFWPTDNGASFSSNWTEAVIGTITVPRKSSGWRVVMQNLDTSSMKPNRLFLDTLYVYPSSQPRTITQAVECPQTAHADMFNDVTYNFANNISYAIAPISVNINLNRLIPNSVKVNFNIFPSSSKRGITTASFTGTCIINGLDCDITIPAFALVPGTYNVEFELVTSTYTHISPAKVLLVNPGVLAIAIIGLSSNYEYIYNSVGSVTINITKAAVGANITLYWMNQTFPISDYVVVGNTARSSISTLITDIGNSTVRVTYANEPYYAPQNVEVAIFVQKGNVTFSSEVASDKSFFTFNIVPTTATGQIMTYRGNMSFNCTLKSGSCVIPAERIAGRRSYDVIYTGDNFFNNDTSSFYVVYNTPPSFRVGNISFQNNGSVLYVGNVVTFTIGFRDPDVEDTHELIVDYGDRTAEYKVDFESLQSSVASVSHIYTSAGVYIVKCTLTDGKTFTNYTFPPLRVNAIFVAPDDVINNSDSTVLAVVLSVVGAVVIVVIVGTLFFVYRKKSRFRKISVSMGKVQKSEIDESEILMHEKLGSGGHSDVYRATFRGTDVAVKVLNSHYFNTPSSISRFEFEVAIMCGLRHPNIILFMGQFLGTYTIPSSPIDLDSPSSSHSSSTNSTVSQPLSNASSLSQSLPPSPSSSPKADNRQLTPSFKLTPVKSQSFLHTISPVKFQEPKKNACIVMEFMSKGSLSDLLLKERVAANCTTSYEINYQLSIRFPDFLLFHIAYSVANGLNFLHQCKPSVIHRDIKTANILVDEKWNIKISDFGITSLLDEQDTDNSVIGTIAFIAPELLSGESVSEKTDIYSFGFVLWEMFHYGADPFYKLSDGLSIALALRNGFRPTIHSSVIPPISDLIQQCWAHNPADRPHTMRSVCRILKELVISHPFVHQKVNLPGEIGNAPESGELYYVFTDIEGSSNLWECLPIAMGDALKLHNLILRHNAHLWRGYEVRFEGDSYFAVFTSVSDAIMFCIYSQRDLLQASWSPDLLRHQLTETVYNEEGQTIFRGLRVRMGINKGESKAEVNPVFHRMDYFGTAVNKAARMLSLTQGGQVFITAAVAREYEQEAAGADPINTINSPQENTSINNTNNTNLSSRSTLSISAFSRAFVEDYSVATTREVGEFKLKGFKNTETVFEVLSSLYPQRVYNIPVVNPDTSSSSYTSSFYKPAMSSSGESSYVNTDSATDEWSEVIGEDLTIHIPLANIKMEKLLCTSPSGSYYKAMWHSLPVTCKVPDTPTVLTESDLLTFKVEVMTLSKLSHQNILHYYGGCLERANVCLVMEYLPYGSLHDFIFVQKKTLLTYAEKLHLLLEVAAGLEYLHAQRVIHRDLKPANLMMAEGNHIKISNFGVSKVKEAARTTVYRGEVAWTAPELLLNKSYTEKVDIYSFGMVMYGLYTSQIPYDNMDVIEAAQAIINGMLPQIPNGIPKAYVELMEKCWEEPQHRPSSYQLCLSLKNMVEEK